mgnify:CR=1 FL=1
MKLKDLLSGINYTCITGNTEQEIDQVIYDSRIKTKKGLFIAMPSRKAGDGEYRDIAHPINSETRERIQTLILQKYDELLEEQAEQADSEEEAGITQDPKNKG